jgi:hypothetical protein
MRLGSHHRRDHARPRPNSQSASRSKIILSAVLSPAAHASRAASRSSASRRVGGRALMAPFDSLVETHIFQSHAVSVPTATQPPPRCARPGLRYGTLSVNPVPLDHASPAHAWCGSPRRHPYCRRRTPIDVAAKNKFIRRARRRENHCRLIPVILKIVLWLRLELRGYWPIVSVSRRLSTQCRLNGLLGAESRQSRRSGS